MKQNLSTHGLPLIHVGGRSAQMNFWRGTPVELIMKISGHESVKDFYKYIRITPEEAGRKMKELWKSRGGMNAFSGEKKIPS